jgi:hypothetical protein
MILSILICTLPERTEKLARLMAILKPQIENINDLVEIKIHDAGRSMPTGTKRNELIVQSQGHYFCFIDDDDVVPEYYVEELLNAIMKTPDVITFIGYMTTNGLKRENFTIRLGSDYVTVDGHHYRFPNHLCCFKRSAVDQVRFQDIWYQEDYRYALEIKNKNLLQSEVHIEKVMYWYDWIPAPAPIKVQPKQGKFRR